MRPGTNTTIQSQLPPATPPTDTGTWFITGVTAQGPIAPQLSLSFAQWQQIYGGRGTQPLMSDSVETFFNEGGSRVYTARVVGPSAVTASVDLLAFASRTDTATVTNASATVADTSITSADQGRPVSGTSIPSNTYVGTVTPGVNFLLSSSATSQVNVTATGAGSSVTLAAVPSCTISAIGPGAYANGQQIVIASVSGGGVTLTVEDSNSNVLEASNTLVTLADLAAYAAGSQYIAATLTGTIVPKTGTSTLASGVDDLANITSGSYTAALALFDPEFGPGQVSAPGNTATAVLTAVVNHAAASQGGPGSRVAYCDLPDTTSASSLVGDASAIRQLNAVARRAALWTPWADIAPATGANGSRAVPPSAFAAGRVAANDATTGNPNQAAAGIRGILSTPIGLHANFSASDRQSLNDAGVNVIRSKSNGFRIYGNVTAVNRLSDPLYYQLSNVRLDMAIEVQADAIAEEYMFSEIDGAGVDQSNFGNELAQMMTAWQIKGALFVGSDGLAFVIDTAADINTPTTIDAGDLIATVAYVRSRNAEQVNLNLVRSSVAQGV